MIARSAPTSIREGAIVGVVTTRRSLGLANAELAVIAAMRERPLGVAAIARGLAVLCLIAVGSGARRTGGQGEFLLRPMTHHTTSVVAAGIPVTVGTPIKIPT
jgi:hypothetical protein